MESELVESHVFSWSRSRFFKNAGVGVGSRFKKSGESESGVGVLNLNNLWDGVRVDFLNLNNLWDGVRVGFLNLNNLWDGVGVDFLNLNNLWDGVRVDFLNLNNLWDGVGILKNLPTLHPWNKQCILDQVWKVGKMWYKNVDSKEYEGRNALIFYMENARWHAHNFPVNATLSYAYL